MAKAPTSSGNRHAHHAKPTNSASSSAAAKKTCAPAPKKAPTTVAAKRVRPPPSKHHGRVALRLNHTKMATPSAKKTTTQKSTTTSKSTSAPNKKPSNQSYKKSAAPPSKVKASVPPKKSVAATTTTAPKKMANTAQSAKKQPQPTHKKKVEVRPTTTTTKREVGANAEEAVTAPQPEKTINVALKGSSSETTSASSRIAPSAISHVERFWIYDGSNVAGGGGGEVAHLLPCVSYVLGNGSVGIFFVVDGSSVQCCTSSCFDEGSTMLLYADDVGDGFVQADAAQLLSAFKPKFHLLGLVVEHERLHPGEWASPPSIFIDSIPHTSRCSSALSFIFTGSASLDVGPYVAEVREADGNPYQVSQHRTRPLRFSIATMLLRSEAEESSTIEVAS